MSHPTDLPYTNNDPAAFRADETEQDSLYDESVQQAAREDILRQAHDTITVLQQRLNEDVARMIVLQLNLLEVWRERQRPSDALGIMERNSPQPCFISSRLARFRPIRQVDFRIESHDQGWVTHFDGGSWSWFTACVVPKTDASVDQDFSGINLSPDHVWDRVTAQTQSGQTTSIFHKDNQISSSITRERELCRNSIASREYQVHTISWSADSDDPEEAAWVRSLQPDERIMVRAWARYGGWSNHVRSVSVSLHTTPLL